jgi:hypothetical protein
MAFAADSLIDGGDGLVLKTGQVFLCSGMADITGQGGVAGTLLESLYLAMTLVACEAAVIAFFGFRFSLLSQGGQGAQEGEAEKSQNGESDEHLVTHIQTSLANEWSPGWESYGDKRFGLPGFVTVFALIDLFSLNVNQLSLKYSWRRLNFY